MARQSTPSFVLELPLRTTPGDERRLDKGLFVAATRLHNALLQAGLALVQAIRDDPAWTAARQLPRATATQRQARAGAFAAVKKAHGFSDYDVQALATQHKNAAGFAGRVR